MQSQSQTQTQDSTMQSQSQTQDSITKNSGNRSYSVHAESPPVSTPTSMSTYDNREKGDLGLNQQDSTTMKAATTRKRVLPQAITTLFHQLDTFYNTPSNYRAKECWISFLKARKSGHFYSYMSKRQISGLLRVLLYAANQGHRLPVASAPNGSIPLSEIAAKLVRIVKSRTGNYLTKNDYEILLKLCRRCKDFEFGIELLDMMVKDGYQIDDMDIQLIYASLKLDPVVAEHNSRPHESQSQIMSQRLLDHGCINDALRKAEEISTNGHAPKPDRAIRKRTKSLSESSATSYVPDHSYSQHPPGDFRVRRFTGILTSLFKPLPNTEPPNREHLKSAMAIVETMVPTRSGQERICNIIETTVVCPNDILELMVYEAGVPPNAFFLTAMLDRGMKVEDAFGMAKMFKLQHDLDGGFWGAIMVRLIQDIHSQSDRDVASQTSNRELAKQLLERTMELSQLGDIVMDVRSSMRVFRTCHELRWTTQDKWVIYEFLRTRGLTLDTKLVMLLFRSLNGVKYYTALLNHVEDTKVELDARTLSVMVRQLGWQGATKLVQNVLGRLALVKDQLDEKGYIMVVDGLLKTGLIEEAVRWHQMGTVNDEDVTSFLIDYMIRIHRRETLAVELLRSWTTENRPCVVGGYAGLIKARGRMGQLDAALDAFEEMSTVGIQPNIRVINSLLLALSENGRFQEARSLANELKELGLVENRETTDMFARRLGLERDYVSLRQLISSPTASAVTLNMGLEGIIGSISDLTDMKDETIKPTINAAVDLYKYAVDTLGMIPSPSTYGIFMKAYAKQAKPDRVTLWYQESRKRDVPAPKMYWDALLEAYGRKHDVPRLLEVYDRWKASGVSASGSTLAILLDAAGWSGRHDLLEKFWTEFGGPYLHERTEKEKRRAGKSIFQGQKYPFNENHYTSLVEAAIRVGHPKLASGVVQQIMPAQGISIGYKTLLTWLSMLHWLNGETKRGVSKFIEEAETWVIQHSSPTLLKKLRDVNVLRG